eukprot:7525230-Pyramimonas_sp.AAC.1
MLVTFTWRALKTPLTSMSNALRVPFGKRQLNKHTHTSCAVRYTKDEDGHVTFDLDESMKQLRPIQHLELTGADAVA